MQKLQCLWGHSYDPITERGNGLFCSGCIDYHRERPRRMRRAIQFSTRGNSRKYIFHQGRVTHAIKAVEIHGGRDIQIG